MVTISRGGLVTSASPLAGMMLPMATRLCSIDIDSLRSSTLNAYTEVDPVCETAGGRFSRCSPPVSISAPIIIGALVGATSVVFESSVSIALSAQRGPGAHQAGRGQTGDT